MDNAEKLDVWFVDQASYDEHMEYATRLRERLTAQSRSIILTIKEAYWRRQEYRDTITSDQIYRAVLDYGVGTVGEFEHFIKRADQSPTQ